MVKTTQSNHLAPSSTVKKDQTLPAAAHQNPSVTTTPPISTEKASKKRFWDSISYAPYDTNEAGHDSGKSAEAEDKELPAWKNEPARSHNPRYNYTGYVEQTRRFHDALRKKGWVWSMA